MRNTVLDTFNVKKGEIVEGNLDIAYMNDSIPVSIPITIIKGLEEGPVLLITGAIHGIEISTIEIIRKVKEIISPQELKGTLIMSPVINPYAYRSSIRHTPSDSMDMNRVFPGTQGSSLTYLLARKISEKLIAPADYVIDCHSCNPPSMQFTIVGKVGNKDTAKKALEMARAFGFPIVFSGKPHSGTFSGYCMDQGKPCITPEFNFSRRLDELSIETGVKGVMNVMKHLKMQAGEIEQFSIPGGFKEELNYCAVHAEKGGVVYFEKEIGQHVKAGESIATIRDLFGNEIEIIKSPYDGIVISYPLKGNQAAETGDYVAYIAY